MFSPLYKNSGQQFVRWCAANKLGPEALSLKHGSQKERKP